MSDERNTCYVCKRKNGQGIETRPYGPNGKSVCFRCMTNSPQLERACKEEFGRQLDAAGELTGAAMLTSYGPIPMVGRR